MTPLFAAFVLASLVLAATPGPGVVYIVTRTLTQGRRAGLASVAGVALGNLGNALGAALGLAALFSVSSLAFDLVRLAGAAYLVWLGLRCLRAPERAAAVPVAPARAADILRDGALVALLNPKTTLFFAAFLPQFIDPAQPSAWQSVVLGVSFVAIAAATDLVYVVTAGLLAPAIAGRACASRLGRWLGAAVYLGLGVFAAVSGARQPR